jgi:RNA polymerase sigma-70 factor (ECF subfamily)
LKDKLLIWKLRHGDKDALCSIYDKYRDDLVQIAAGLLNDVSTAEDIVQDVFLTLVRSADKYEIRRSLKAYLTTCVVNKVRNLSREKSTLKPMCLDDVEPVVSNIKTPDKCVECNEEFQHLYVALTQLPYEQKETVILRIQGKIKFKEISKLQGTSIKTTLSRYNYGLNKLRSMLNGDPLHPRRFALPNEAAGEDAGAGVKK